MRVAALTCLACNDRTYSLEDAPEACEGCKTRLHAGLMRSIVPHGERLAVKRPLGVTFIELPAEDAARWHTIKADERHDILAFLAHGGPTMVRNARRSLDAGSD